MAETDEKPVTLEELLVSMLAQIDAFVKLLNEFLNKRKLANKTFRLCIAYSAGCLICPRSVISADTSPLL
jgi:hypothetical protein